MQVIVHAPLREMGNSCDTIIILKHFHYCSVTRMFVNGGDWGGAGTGQGQDRTLWGSYAGDGG